jgi:hypothetical protein
MLYFVLKVCLYDFSCISGIGEKEKENVSYRATTPTEADNRNIADTPEVVLRRTQSFEADEK